MLKRVLYFYRQRRAAFMQSARRQLILAAICVFAPGATFATPPCDTIAQAISALEDEVHGLEADIADWQKLLQNAGTSEKPAIGWEIKKLQNKLTKDKQELAKQKNALASCQALAGSPTGGEPFPIYGGVFVTPTQIAHLSIHCAPLPPLSPFGVQQWPPLNASPAPSVAWRASFCGGQGSYHKANPADAQIAVSSTHVVVSFENALAWYDKMGNKQGELTSFALFGPLLPGLADTVGMANEANDCGNGNKSCARTQSDMRVVFDEHRRRFWALGGAGVYTADRDPKKQRGILLLAVSQTENPSDGWHIYWFDAVAHWGKNNDPIYQAGDKADYPSIAFDSFGFYETNLVSDMNNNGKYTHLVVFPADTLAAGTPASGWHYFDLRDTAGHTVTNVIQPAIHHGSAPHAYFVSTMSQDEVLIWALTDPLKPSQTIQRVAVGLVDGKGSLALSSPPDAPQLNGNGTKIDMSNLGNYVLKAVYRAGTLAFVANDAQMFPDPQDPMKKKNIAVSVIRLVKMSVLGFPALPALSDPGNVDVRFGSTSPDDSANNRMYAGWPAVEIDSSGALAVVYARSGASIHPEVRYNALLANDTDVRPSRLLKSGDGVIAPGGSGVFRWGDTAGAAVDAKDDTGIWLAQQYANATGSWDIWVARVF